MEPKANYHWISYSGNEFKIDDANRLVWYEFDENGNKIRTFEAIPK